MPCTEDIGYEEGGKNIDNIVPTNCSTVKNCNGETTKTESLAITNEETNGTAVKSPIEQSTRSLVNPTISFNALHPLPGEEFENENCVDLCHCRLFLTQYRIIIVTHNYNAACAIPLLDVESIEAKDIVGLHILCKDGRIIRVQAANSETAITWYKKLIQVTCVARNLDDLFTFKFYKTIKYKMIPWIRKDVERRRYSSLEALAREYKHLDLKEISWKVTTVNEDFELCPTYPQYLIVPSSVSNEELMNMRQARYYYRFPTLVWRNKRTGALLYRSSQPTVGFFGMGIENDVKLYEKMKNAYKDAEIIFMGLPNIHNIRYSFHQLRLLLNSPNDQTTYLQALQSTMWLQNIGCLFSATERCLNALYDGISVLVHCSDGWDRTTQIVSLSMLIADSYYRTFEGFEMLIQRQWIEFGHKFADRSGVLNGDENERSPVFLQFLDCVYQLWMKNPDAFEFNRRYLHTYSGLFSSFLFNSINDSIKAGCTLPDKSVEPHRISITSMDKSSGAVDEQKQLRAFSIWDYLGKHNYEFINPAYNAKYAHQKTMLVFPKLMSEFELWRDAYCCTAAQMSINNPEIICQPATTTTATPNSTTSTLNNTSGSVSSHEGALEKAATTLSRSQSASSLTSLELNTTGIQPLHISSHYNNSTITPHPIGSISSTTSNLSSYMTRMSDNTSLSSWHSQNFLDVDGLTKVPIVFEDRQLELQANNNKRFTENHYHRDMNGRYPNGDLNGTTNNNTQNYLTFNGTSTNLTTTRRVRNESIDSTTLGFEFIDDFDPNSVKRKHDSSGNSSACSKFENAYECGGCKNMIRARMSSVNLENHHSPHCIAEKTKIYGSLEEIQCHTNVGSGQLVVG